MSSETPTDSPVCAVILAGGQGKRLGLSGPKVLAPLCGAPALEFVIEAALALDPARCLVVVCHQRAKVETYLGQRFPACETLDQVEAGGTGHAVLQCAPRLAGFDGDILVLFGDSPLVRAQTLRALVDLHRSRRAACTMLTAELPDPTTYGRVLRDAGGRFQRIVEESDASPAEREIREVHCGLAVFRGGPLFEALPRLKPENRQGELYLTDVYEEILKAGGRVETAPLLEPQEALGFNTREQLLDIQGRLRARLVADHLRAGVQFEDPASAFIEKNVTIGEGTIIRPFSVIRSGVVIGRGCDVGPFCQIRAGTVLEDGAEVGNYVEVKNSRLHRGVKAKHLAYLGDAEIGAKTNIGAGTIIANYDGKHKHHTKIGAAAFVGSGTILVAPVEVGDRAIVGAGSVVPPRHDVAADTVVVGVPARLLRRRPPPDPQRPS